MNPYFGCNGWEMVICFFHRMGLLMTGGLSVSELASDEIQFFVLSLISLSCALIGVLLVLKKMTMLANSLSHTILPGLVGAYLLCGLWWGSEGLSLNALPLEVLGIAAVMTALLTAGVTQLFHRLFKLSEDASVGLVCTAMVAVGVVLVTVFTRSMHLGIEAVMGNVDALHPHDLVLALGITVINALVVLFFFKEWKLVCFDPGFAVTQGMAEQGWSYLLMGLTSLTVIGAFRAVGMLLVLSLLVGPVLTARLFTIRLTTLLSLASGIGIGASALSVVLSRHLLSVYQISLSTAGLLATVLGLVYFVSLAWMKWREGRQIGSTKIRASRQDEGTARD